MKQIEKNGKGLKLDKKVITNLNQHEMESIKGGKMEEQSSITITYSISWSWSITYTWSI
ncbi:class I lanthipeptide [Flavobacterium sp. Arc3]|uniref:class I lanthipeptide n=1 Tax=Flavobacterium sp. Arc3 TaxID=3046686 RepID=UPI00352D1C8A